MHEEEEAVLEIEDGEFHILTEEEVDLDKVKEMLSHLPDHILIKKAQ